MTAAIAADILWTVLSPDTYNLLYAGVVSFSPPTDPFWLDVDADGNWAIQMNPF